MGMPLAKRVPRRIAAFVVAALAATSLAVVGSTSPATAEDVYAVPPSGVWNVDGAGWGHGIGMSQWGAQGAALAGLGYADILGFYYPGTVLGYVANPTIRVQLTRYAGSALVFGRVGSEQLTARDVASGQVIALPASSRYLMNLDGSGMYLGHMTSAGWSSIAWPSGYAVAGPIQISGPSGALMYDANLSGAGTEYREVLRLVRTGTTSAQAVNVLAMNSYLKGVVPRESPSWWHTEALRAQAVAARSYALSVSRAGGSWDLCDTTQCQVYGGRSSVSADGTVTQLETAATTAAIDATSGVVVAADNKPAFTQFSSSNGGYSVAGSQPYLVAQPDPYSGSAPGDNVSRWQAKLPASRLQARCPSGGTLNSFAITGRDGRGPFGGRITGIRVNCTTGSANITSLSALSFGMLSRMWAPAAPQGMNPTGTVERLSITGGMMRLTGWTLDPDTTSPIEVHVYVDGGGTNLGLADDSRPDVGAAFPGYGDNHGFDASLWVGSGSHRVCIYGINNGAGANVPLTCQTLQSDPNPLGHAELVAPGSSPASIRMAGWALDPDQVGPIEVHAYIDGGGHNLGLADDARSDVASAYVGYGEAHGFDATIYAAPGSHQVCLYAINVGAGSHTSLGCRSVTVSGTPLGNLEQAYGSKGAVAVSGWALDPDTRNPIEIHVYVDGGGTNLGPTPLQRPDVEAVYPGFGAQHGFSASFSVPAGSHDVCTYAINVGHGANTLLGCRTVSST